MRRDVVLVVLLLAAIAAGSTWAIIHDYRQRQAHLRTDAPVAPQPLPAAVQPTPFSPEPLPPPAPRALPASRPQHLTVRPLKLPQPEKRADQRPVPDAPITKEVAREALAMVGADPAAEQTWTRAINDPDMPPKVRQDLIEDLNEHGFADPRNLTADDLPLIANRIAIVERMAPDSMDDVNYRAFQEAYKDLVNMYNRVAGQQ
jgi:hypothetical protein